MSIPTRLLFLVGVVDPDRQAHAHRLAHLGRHIYARTSDVLHGRMNALDVGEALLDEWRAVVEELERLLPASV